MLPLDHETATTAAVTVVAFVVCARLVWSLWLGSVITRGRDSADPLGAGHTIDTNTTSIMMLTVLLLLLVVIIIIAAVRS
jgi:hypothetical protein